MDNPLSLLIIDDNQEVLDALNDFFTHKNCKVQSALNGLDGIKLLESKHNAIDLVITDIVMPHVSGVAIISIVKKKYPEIPVIAITGWGEYPEAMAAEAQADLVLEKPFDLSELESFINQLMAQKRK